MREGFASVGRLKVTWFYPFYTSQLSTSLPSNICRRSRRIQSPVTERRPTILTFMKDAFLRLNLPSFLESDHNSSGHIIAIASSHPMVEECKQDPGATTQQDYKIEEDEEEEAIRPSIPSIIPLKSHDDARANSSSGDDCSEALSVSSLISEVTLMTFSEEKAAMLRSEFISRVEQDSHTRPLSRDEKLALLSEIQADQDKKFKVEMQRQETKRNMKREGEKTRHEFFERLNALRVNNGIDMKTVVQQQQQQMERDQIDTSEYTSTSESGGGGGQEEVNSGDSGTQDEEKKKERQGPCRRASMMRRYRRASGLSSSGKKIWLISIYHIMHVTVRCCSRFINLCYCRHYREAL